MIYRRRSPGNIEQERMIRGMRDNFPGEDLTDKETFNSVWEDYFSQNEAFAVSTGIRDETYNKFLFKKAKGRSLERDRQITAKDKVETPKQYIRRGAQRVDLPGVDTRADRFSLIGKRKGKLTRARVIFIKWRGKRIRRYIDKRGRYVSIK